MPTHFEPPRLKRFSTDELVVLAGFAFEPVSTDDPATMRALAHIETGELVGVCDYYTAASISFARLSNHGAADDEIKSASALAEFQLRRAFKEDHPRRNIDGIYSAPRVTARVTMWRRRCDSLTWALLLCDD